MATKITDDRIKVMQQSADTSLRDTGLILLLAEDTNDLLDERAFYMIPEIARLTDLLTERDEQLLNITTEREKLRKEVDSLRSFESDVRGSISRQSQTDAHGARSALLSMRVGDSRTFGRPNSGLRGRTFVRTAVGWETDVHVCVLSIDDAVAYIRAHDMLPLT